LYGISTFLISAFSNDESDEKQNAFKKCNENIFLREVNMDQRITRKPELFSRLGLSDATIWRMERAGKFPRRIQIGGKAVGWFDSEINNWMNQKSADRQAPAEVSR